MDDQEYCIVRWAQVADAKILGEIHVSSWRKAYGGIVPDDFLAALSTETGADMHQRGILRNPKNKAVIEVRGQIAGFCGIGDCHDSDKPSEDTGEIGVMYLAPSYWRKGLGSKLIRWVENELRLRGKKEIVLWVLEANTPSRCFYEAMGYRHDGARKMVTIGIPLPVVRHSKTL